MAEGRGHWKMWYSDVLVEMQWIDSMHNIVSTTALNVLPTQLWIQVLWGLKLKQVWGSLWKMI